MKSFLLKIINFLEKACPEHLDEMVCLELKDVKVKEATLD